MAKAKPFIKWVGGKGQLTGQLEALLPVDFHKRENVKKHQLYKFLAENGVDWKKHLSKKLLPDNCIYVIVNNTAFILEVKHQQIAGSVDEKLQTCDFKKKQYVKLFSQLNYKVEYCYVLDSWFRKPEYLHRRRKTHGFSTPLQEVAPRVSRLIFLKDGFLE